MELWQQILNRARRITDDEDEIFISKILSSACYTALESIKKVLEDSTLEDDECFMQIENIVCIFEALGSDCGARHDF